MNIKLFSKALIVMIVLSSFLYSCNIEEDKFPGYSKTDEGLFYKFHNQSGDTIAPNEGDILSLNIKTYTADTVLDIVPPGRPFMIPLSASDYDGDFYSALAMMKVGDSATFILHADSFFTKTVKGALPDYLDSNTFMFLDIKMLEIKTQAQMDKERMENEKMKMIEEKAIIAEYIATNSLQVVEDPSGVYFAENKAGSGSLLSVGSFADMHIVAKTVGVTGMTFIDSYSVGKTFPYEVGSGQLGVGFETGLMKMKKGSKATFIVPFSLAFGAQRVKEIAPYSTIVFDVEIMDITSAEEMKIKQEKEAKERQTLEAASAKEEQNLLMDYIMENRVTATPTSSGLYYIEKVAGTGKQAIAGKKVKVNYTGKLLNGEVFDSSDGKAPIEFVLGQRQVIVGWDEGLALMKEGGKAQLIIPSHLAYGPQGRAPVIPPSATLVFDIELIEVIE